MTPNEALSNSERVVTVANGWTMLTVLLALLLTALGLLAYSIAAGSADRPFVLPLVTLRHSREMTLFCSPKVTHNHTGEVALLPPGKRTPGQRGPHRRRTNWFGKNEWVAEELVEARPRGALSCPRASVRKSCSSCGSL